MAEIEKSNLFQLNVILWASTPAPAGAPTTPILLQLGYEVDSIEAELHSPLAQRGTLKGAEVEISLDPVVDVVLRHGHDHCYSLVELKPSSFSEDSSNANQARGLLAAAGDLEPRVPSAGDSDSELTYVTPSEDVIAMAHTLVGLSAQVSATGVPVPHTGAVGVGVRRDGVYLGAEPPVPDAFSTLSQRLIPAQRVVQLESGQDPRPLYFIPWIPGGTDFDHDVLREKIRSQVILTLPRFPGLLASGHHAAPTAAVYSRS